MGHRYQCQGRGQNGKTCEQQTDPNTAKPGKTINRSTGS
jgi:hypothetical protein